MPIRMVPGIVAGCLLFMASAQAAALPPRFLGLWAHEKAACNEPNSDGRVTVGPSQIDFHASGYSIRTWSHRNDKWEGRGRVHEEGEEGSRAGRITLQPISDGRLLIIAGGERLELVRCDASR